MCRQDLPWTQKWCRLIDPCEQQIALCKAKVKNVPVSVEHQGQDNSSTMESLHFGSWAQKSENRSVSRPFLTRSTRPRRTPDSSANWPAQYCEWGTPNLRSLSIKIIPCGINRSNAIKTCICVVIDTSICRCGSHSFALVGAGLTHIGWLDLWLPRLTDFVLLKFWIVYANQGHSHGSYTSHANNVVRRCRFPRLAMVAGVEFLVDNTAMVSVPIGDVT